MSKSRYIMTPRTFGLFSAIAAISVGAFTSYLVLATPGASNRTNEPDKSNTAQIDDARTIANLSKADKTMQNQQLALGSDGAANKPAKSASSGPEISKQLGTTATTASSSNSIPEPKQQSTSTAPSKPAPAQSPTPVTDFIDSTVGTLESLLPGLKP